MSVDRRTMWETYVASWRAESMDEKRGLFERCLAPDCIYADPLVRASGWNELAAYMTDLQRQVPGGHFVTERFIAHHGTSMAMWRMLNGAAVQIGEGVSIGEYGEDGRLAKMTGFFETPAPQP